MKYRVTLRNRVNDNQHITVHKDRATAEAYGQGYIDWQLIPPELITIEEVDGDGMIEGTGTVSTCDANNPLVNP